MTELTHYRRQANDVIRRTVAHIRDKQQEVIDITASGGDPRESEIALMELTDVLRAMVALRRTAGK